MTFSIKLATLIASVFVNGSVLNRSSCRVCSGRAQMPRDLFLGQVINPWCMAIFFLFFQIIIIIIYLFLT